MLKLKTLSKDLQKIAIEELDELPARTPQDLKALKVWLKTQPHLKARKHDQFLIQFLRGCKYSLEGAKKKLDLFYSLRMKYPKMLNVIDVDGEKFRKIINFGILAVLPEPLNGNGPRIIVYKFNYPTTEYHTEEVIQAFSAMHEILINHDPYACVHGIIYIVDFASASAGHYEHMSLEFLKRILAFLESIPLRVRSINYINTSDTPQKFFADLLPCFSKEMGSIVHIYGKNYSDMLTAIPVEYLPEDFGGIKPSILKLCSDYQKVWDANREYFKENAQYGTDELLRAGKPFELENYFGASGPFKAMY